MLIKFLWAKVPLFCVVCEHDLTMDLNSSCTDFSDITCRCCYPIVTYIKNEVCHFKLNIILCGSVNCIPSCRAYVSSRTSDNFGYI